MLKRMHTFCKSTMHSPFSPRRDCDSPKLCSWETYMQPSAKSPSVSFPARDANPVQNLACCLRSSVQQLKRGLATAPNVSRNYASISSVACTYLQRSSTSASLPRRQGRLSALPPLCEKHTTPGRPTPFSPASARLLRPVFTQMLGIILAGIAGDPSLRSAVNLHSIGGCIEEIARWPRHCFSTALNNMLLLCRRPRNGLRSSGRLRNAMRTDNTRKYCTSCNSKAHFLQEQQHGKQPLKISGSRRCFAVPLLSAIAAPIDQECSFAAAAVFGWCRRKPHQLYADNATSLPGDTWLAE